MTISQPAPAATKFILLTARPCQIMTELSKLTNQNFAAAGCRRNNKMAPDPNFSPTFSLPYPSPFSPATQATVFRAANTHLFLLIKTVGPANDKRRYTKWFAKGDEQDQPTMQAIF